MISWDFTGEFKTNRITICETYTSGYMFSMMIEEREGTINICKIMTNIHDLTRYNKNRADIYNNIYKKLEESLISFCSEKYDLGYPKWLNEIVLNEIKNQFNNEKMNSEINYEYDE